MQPITDQSILSSIMESFPTVQRMSISGGEGASLGNGSGAGSVAVAGSALSDLHGLQFQPSASPGILGSPPPLPSASSQLQQVQIDEVLSEPRVLLRPEVGGGLSVTLAFRFGVRPMVLPGANCLFILVKNCGEQIIRYEGE